MKHTTLFGSASQSAQALTNTTNITDKNRKQSLQSPRSLSDYFKKCSNIQPQENHNTDISIILDSSLDECKTDEHTTPLKRITKELNECKMNVNTPEVNKKVTKDINNLITSHFLPKKIEETFASSFDEDEVSLKKTKPKLPEEEIYLKEDNLKFDNFKDILAISEFLYDFQELLDGNSDGTWDFPDFRAIYKALKSCEIAENFTLLASILLRFMNYLNTEPFEYFGENVSTFITFNNVAAILKIYLCQKNGFTDVDKLKIDFYSLPFDLKVSIINLLIEDVMDSSNFRSFFENNNALIDDLKRKLKVLQSEVCQYNREIFALKQYSTKKQKGKQSSLLDIAVIDTDKENVDNLTNQQAEEEDIDTRVHKHTGKLNHSLREITKTQAKLERAESMVFSKKRICVDSYGRNYYYLKSFSETTVLIEIDENLKYLSDSQGEQPEDNLIHSNNDKLSTFSEMTGDAIWLEYSTESELDSLIKFLKSSKCDKKVYLPIEEIKSKIRPTLQEDTLEVESHYLRSVNKNTVSHNCFTFKEFATQLLEFGEDLLYSSLVSTNLDCLDWTDNLSNEDWSYTTGISEELRNKLLSLINSLTASTKVNISESAMKYFIDYNTPTLSQLFLLLDYCERNVNPVDSRYDKYCTKCHKKIIWNDKKYTPLFACKECSKTFHLTCQDPPLTDIPTEQRCSSCRNAQNSTSNKFYRTREQQISEDESSSEAEEVVVRRRSQRYKAPVNSYNASPDYSKYEKKRRMIASSDSEDQSPYTRRRGLRSMSYQPPKKKTTNKQPSEYMSKLRSACP